MAVLKALLWDVDGTLADTERDGHRVAFNQAFQQAGLDWHWDEVLYGELLSVTGGKERIQYFIERYQPTLPASGINAGFIAQLHQLKTQAYISILQSGKVPLRVGVRRLLLEAREAGLRLAIVTTTTPTNVHYLLSTHFGEDAITWFDCMAAGDCVAKKKPDPAIYQYALRTLGLKPEECIALEDSENGLHAAQGAGIKTVITVNTYTQDQDFSAAELVLDQLGEPPQPFTVLQGDAGAQQWVNVALLKHLAAQP